MLRFAKTIIFPKQPKSKHVNYFVRLLRSESVRLTCRFDDAELPPHLRYAPMQRLLANVDLRFLEQGGCPKAAARLRREHGRCYRQFLHDLRREIHEVRRLRGLAMASAGRWDFWSLVET